MLAEFIIFFIFGFSEEFAIKLLSFSRHALAMQPHHLVKFKISKMANV